MTTENPLNNRGAMYTISELKGWIENLETILKYAYCEKIGADSIVGLDCCDNYRDWVNHLLGWAIKDLEHSGDGR